MSHEHLFSWSAGLCPLKTIILQVCEQEHVAFKTMVGPRRHHRLAKVRRKAYWRCYNETEASLPQIGRAFNRDHTTILWGIRKYAKENGITDIPSIHSVT